MPSKGLRSPTVRTRKTGMGAALYMVKSGILTGWHTRRAMSISKEIRKLIHEKPNQPLTKALHELEVIQAKIEMNKEFQRAMVTATRGYHQIVNLNQRNREVAKGRRNILTIRKDMKDLLTEREKIQEKIEHEMKQIIE